MARLLPILLVVAALAVAALLILGGGPEQDGALPTDETGARRREADPELLTSEAARRHKQAQEAAARRAAAARHAAPPARTQALFLAGRVLDAGDGAPLGGAVVSAEGEGARWPLPPALRSATGLVEGPRTNGSIGVPPVPGSATCGVDGRFRWMVDATGSTDPSAFDVFAVGRGHVPAVVHKPPAGKEVVFRLAKAVPLQVQVGDRNGRPVAGASVVVKPGPDTKGLLGHAGAGTSDESGVARVDGLAPGRVLLHVDHPEFMPLTVGPFDPAEEGTQDVRLQPAFRLSLRIRSDDGSAIHNPVLSWSTDGVPPHRGATLLSVSPNGTPQAPLAEVTSEPVRISCEPRNVNLEVKAKGFEAWRQVEPVPPEGGERELLVTLVRDTTLGPLEIAFTGPDGKALSYATLGGPLPSIMNLDGRDIGTLTVESGKTLVFESLPAGHYRIAKRTPDWAPVQVDVEVRAREPNKVTVQLHAAAKLRLRFTATETHVVRFRLLRGHEVLPAFPQGADAKAGLGSAARLDSSGTWGVFGGLSSGPCTIEVTSPDLVAERRTVQLQEGETTEVEIEVRAR
jgi:hypothetical protein